MIVQGYTIEPDAYLTGANLFGAKLTGADLSGADLSGANLSGARLSGADLSGADLSGADLYRADLSGADLSGARLSGADLSEAYLRGADLSGADLSRADLSGAILPNGMTLPEYIAWLPAGFLTQGGKTVAEVSAAWDQHQWRTGPMSVAFCADSLEQVPEAHRSAAALFVALFDGGHLPRPTEAT